MHSNMQRRNLEHLIKSSSGDNDLYRGLQNSPLFWVKKVPASILWIQPTYNFKDILDIKDFDLKCIENYLDNFILPIVDA